MPPTGKSKTYNIVEIFDSIEGEGKRAGQTATFIRLAGCNLNCTYCDTQYAQSEEGHTFMSLDEIMSRLKKRNFLRATITGGEPLNAPEIDILIQCLLTSNHEVNIETNGSIDISEILDKLQAFQSKLFFTMDYKLPSSGEVDKMRQENFDKLRAFDVLKFVIGHQVDINHMLDFLTNLKSTPQIYIGTVFDGYPLNDLADAIINNDLLKKANLQLQFHKIIWSPEQRGV